MDIYGQHFSKPLVDRIQETIWTEPSISRRELSRRICEWQDWRSPSGRLQDMSCRKALAELNRRGILDLPEQQRPYGFEQSSGITIKPNIAELSCKLAELGEITVEPVTSRYAKESKIWFALLERYHYLGSGPLCGAQIRYVIKSPRYGYLGALAFNSASWTLKARDQHIGWTEAARRANLHRLVGNNRFLTLPTVRVENLASHALSLALARLPQDWEQRYPVRPVALETFVDPSRFDGTCYKAANWNYIGDTAGRRDGIPKWGIAVFLLYNPRRVTCPEHGVRVEYMPWSMGKKNISYPLITVLAFWARILAWDQVASLFNVSWHTVKTAVQAAVQYGRAQENYL